MAKSRLLTQTYITNEKTKHSFAVGYNINMNSLSGAAYNSGMIAEGACKVQGTNPGKNIQEMSEVMMNQYLAFAQLLKSILPGDVIFINEPMKNHTNFKLGGPADIMVIPEDRRQLMLVLDKAREYHIPCFVMGNGSNIIVRDGGIRGMVIKLERLNSVQVKGDTIVAESGAEIIQVSGFALDHSLTGLEFACGIPGSVGGAVFMNAGAYGGEMSDVLESVTALTPEGRLVVLNKDELELGYRTSRVKTQGYIVLEAVMRLKPAEETLIREKMAELTRKREDRQPLEYPSGGSTFKRPEGYFAGKLIEDSGLRGYTMGGAAVSDKHCGFLINKDEASAAEILSLIGYVQKVVLDKFGVRLETEVLIVGEESAESELAESGIVG